MRARAIVLILVGVIGLAGTAWGEYCSASGGCGGGFPGGEYITDVMVGDINNTDTGCDGYADYTSLSTTMEIGTDYPITVVNGDGWLWEETCGIWVDWNQDEDFDDAAEAIAVGGGPKTFVATITPPADANLGDTRMRIRIRNSGAPEPCGDTSYGEVEDYTINVIAATPEYCEARGESPFCDAGEIMSFKLKTIDNYTGYCGHYSDFTSISTELEIGTGYPFVVQATSGSHCGMWVDWNQDMDFNDVNEQIDVTYFTYKDPPYGDTTIYTSLRIGIITPPEGAVLGATRLRVRTQFSATILPCGNTAYGEVEDYTVILTENGTSGEEGYGGGKGTEEQPFLIYTAEQMQAIGENSHHWAKHFKLIADIDLFDLEPNTFNIIGDYMFGFEGVFDGNCHTISNVGYDTTDEHRIGIFGEVTGYDAVIRNLGIIDPNIQAGGGQGIGALIGILRQGTVSNCYVNGGFVSGQNAVGGLVGGNHSNIENCYSTTSVSALSSFGGLVGKAVGGTTADSFWDIQTCLPATGSAGGTGKTTTEMQTESTYSDAGWDFVEIWNIGENQTYPFLRTHPAGDLDHNDKVNFSDVAILCSHWLEEK